MIVVVVASLDWLFVSSGRALLRCVAAGNLQSLSVQG